jgi:hypothetical protein
LTHPWALSDPFAKNNATTSRQSPQAHTFDIIVWTALKIFIDSIFDLLVPVCITKMLLINTLYNDKKAHLLIKNIVYLRNKITQTTAFQVIKPIVTTPIC